MTTALVVSTSPPAASALVLDLEAVGIHVLGAATWGNLVQEVTRTAPDVIVAQEGSPGASLFDSAALLLASTPRPLLLFTQDPDADKMEAAVRAGISGYVVNGYVATRLRSLIHLALARFKVEQALRDEVRQLSGRFEERKLVDRAKGILMRARQVPEDEAFRMLRAASMHANLRVGQVSQQVIDAARYAEAVNRAGQVRMLSQRLVKLQALRALDAPAADQAVLAKLIAQSSERVDANLVALKAGLSRSTYGDLLDAVSGPWQPLKAALKAPADRTRLPGINALAERLLQQADRLTTNLETSGATASLHVINLSGRQRMLSQRLAKATLLAVLLDGTAGEQARDEAAQARAAFELALKHLAAAPLSNAEIRESLDAAGRTWAQMSDALARAQSGDGQRQLAQASEALLELFEQLTDRYERSMQMLIG